MNLFGKKKTSSAPPPVPINVIGNLQTQLQMLAKREELLDKRIQQCIQDALQKKKRNDTKGIQF